MKEQTFTAAESHLVEMVRLDGEDITPSCIQFTAAPLPDTPQMGEATIAIRNKAGTIQMNAMQDGPATKRIVGVVEWVASIYFYP